MTATDWRKAGHEKAQSLVGPQRQAGIDQKAVAVLHQPMPDEAQPGLFAFALFVKPRIRIGR